MTDLPSGTVTFLFTDIEGSTQLLRELGAAYVETLEEHRRTLRAAFTAHAGVEVDNQGDAFFAAFQRPADAVAAASVAQRELSRGRVRVRVRMGIHTGTPLRSAEGYVGLDVHRGARICAAGHGGQVLISREARSGLAADVEVRDLGEHRLKDLPDPEWLFQLLGDGLPSSFPPLRSLSNTNLPAEVSSLVGRQAEIDALTALIRRNDVRLVTLSGPGGIGKTRLAYRVAANLVEDFRNGVFQIPLSTVSDPTLVLPTIAQVLGVRERAGETLMVSVRRNIESKSMLLVVDNFEQVLAAATVISEMLASAPQLKVIATSRERLRLSGELEFPVSALPDDDARLLFEQRAYPTSTVIDPSDRAAIAEICRRLDRLPLAIELAAARVKSFAPRELLERLDVRLPMLSGGARDLPERQQTLRSTIAWSYDLLEPSERDLFAALSVFAGGCTFAAAEFVCSATANAMASLLDKSLLRRDRDRYRMLETIREFARERLAASGREDELRERHATHVAALLVPLAEEARRSVATAFPKLDAEHDNARAAFDWSLAHGDVATCARLVEGLCFYWLQKGLVGEGYRRAKAAFDRAPAPSAFFTLLTAELARYHGDLVVGVDLKERAVRAYEEAGDPSDLAMSLSDLADTLVEAREFERAEAAGSRALAIRLELGRPWGIAHARDPLARLALERGDYTRAAALADEIIVAWRDAASWADVAWDSVLAATAFRRAGQLPQARDRLLEGIRVGLDAHHAMAVIPGIEQAAAVAAERGRDEIALRLAGAARALRDSTGFGFATDDTAARLSGARQGNDRAHALMAEGAEWDLETAARRSVASLEDA